jgi:hypothetical protein
LSNLCILVNEGEDLLETYQRRRGLAVDSREVSKLGGERGKEDQGRGGGREGGRKGGREGGREKERKDLVTQIIPPATHLRR